MTEELIQAAVGLVKTGGTVAIWIVVGMYVCGLLKFIVGWSCAVWIVHHITATIIQAYKNCMECKEKGIRCPG